MYRQFTRPLPRVKPTRHTARPAEPFGCGILCRSAADEAWWAAERIRREESADADLEERALQDAWDRLWEQSWAAEPRCAACGRVVDDGELTAGLCDACVLTIDAPWSREGDTGGICAMCERECDFLEPSGLCLPCDMAATDASTMCQTGLRRVY